MDDGRHPQSARTGNLDPDIHEILQAHTAMLRALIEQVGQLAQLLAPAPKDGPSLDEMLATIASLLGEQTATLTDIDERLIALGTDLPPVIAREIARTQRNRDLNA